MAGVNFKNIKFSFSKEDLWMLFAVVFSIAYVKIFNITEIYENTFVENFQLIPLIISFVLCVKAKNYKKFFTTAAIVIMFMFLRELSYGRTIFCLIPNDPYNTYPWSHYKYGFLVNYIIGGGIALCALWFIIKKAYLEFFDVLKKTLFPFQTFFISALLIFIQLYAEKTLESTVVEEIAEFTLYFAILAIVLIYKRQLSEK